MYSGKKSNISNVFLYFRIVGLVLFLVGSSIHAIFALRERLLLNIHHNMKHTPLYIFVTLENSERKNTPGNTHYFYIYSGNYNGVDFSRTEEVSSDYFFTHSEGKNVEALVVLDGSGSIQTRLRGNRHPPSYLNFLQKNAMVLWLTGLIFLAAGSIQKLFFYRIKFREGLPR